MQIPPSRHFTPLSLGAHFNVDRQTLDGGLSVQNEGDWSARRAFGAQSYRGIPFDLGQPGAPNAILLDESAGEIRIEVPDLRATYLVFLHAVEDAPAEPLPDFNWSEP